MVINMKVCNFCGAVLSDTDMVCIKCGAGADDSNSMSDTDAADIMKDAPVSSMMDDAYAPVTPAASATPAAQYAPSYNQGNASPPQLENNGYGQSAYVQQRYNQPAYGTPPQTYSSYIPAGSYVESVSESDVLKISDVLILAASGIIPLAYIILLIVWATGYYGRSRKNLAVANLILIGIGIVLAVVLAILIPIGLRSYR